MVDQLEWQSNAGIAEIFSHDPCCRDKRSDLHFYYVWNKADNRALVLALTPDCALYLARRAGHIKAKGNGIAGLAPPGIWGGDDAYSGSLRRARSEGCAGFIKRVGDFATMPEAGRVFPPLSSVG